MSFGDAWFALLSFIRVVQTRAKAVIARRTLDADDAQAKKDAADRDPPSPDSNPDHPTV